MNKFNVVFYLALAAAAIAIVADANLFKHKKDNDQQAIDVGNFGAVDVIENGIPDYAAARDAPCAKNKNQAACNECCIKNGFTKGFYPKKLERLRGMNLLSSPCTCVVDSLSSE